MGCISYRKLDENIKFKVYKAMEESSPFCAFLEYHYGKQFDNILDFDDIFNYSINYAYKYKTNGNGISFKSQFGESGRTKFSGYYIKCSEVVFEKNDSLNSICNTMNSNTISRSDACAELAFRNNNMPEKKLLSEKGCALGNAIACSMLEDIQQKYIEIAKIENARLLALENEKKQIALEKEAKLIFDTQVSQCTNQKNDSICMNLAESIIKNDGNLPDAQRITLISCAHGHKPACDLNQAITNLIAAQNQQNNQTQMLNEQIANAKRQERMQIEAVRAANEANRLQQSQIEIDANNRALQIMTDGLNQISGNRGTTPPENPKRTNEFNNRFEPPFCVVDRWGTKCQYWDISSCRTAAKQQDGMCVNR